MEGLEERNRFDLYWHDSCMNGGKPVEMLNEVFGEGKWLDRAPKPCKFRVGERDVNIKASSKRKAHKRTIGIFKPKERCGCNLPPNALCSKAPDLNGVENVWNKVETDLKELGKREGWPKNREELIERLKQILDGIPNSYFKKLYASYPDRWRKCVKLGGRMTDFYIPKHN